MNEQLTIRKATVEERTALEALQWRASLVWEDYRAALLAHPDAIELPDAQIASGQVLVAERHGALAGFAVVLPRDDGQAELDGLFVEPDLWRRGIASALVKVCEEMARAQGADSLHVIGNPSAKGFYFSCDFKHVGDEQTRFGVGLLMEKKLA